MLPKPLSAGYVSPMLPTLVDEAPDGKEWLHEIKYDGYRTQLAIEGQMIRAFTRNGHDWSDRYVPVIASARALRCRSAILDGEMCVQAASGVTDFAALRSAIKGAPQRLVLFAFDLLMLDRRDLRAEPLVDRRRRLRDLIGVEIATRVHFSGDRSGGGPAFFKAADAHGLEGIVSKRADSRYRSGRSDAWLKIKSFTVGDFAVIGVERSLAFPSRYAKASWRACDTSRARRSCGTRRSRRSTSASCWRTISVAATNRTSKAAAAPHKAESILAWRR